MYSEVIGNKRLILDMRPRIDLMCVPSPLFNQLLKKVWTGQQISILNMICFNSVLQLAIDQARGYYLNLLYRYLSLTYQRLSSLHPQDSQRFC